MKIALRFKGGQIEVVTVPNDFGDRQYYQLAKPQPYVVAPGPELLQPISVPVVTFKLVPHYVSRRLFYDDHDCLDLIGRQVPIFEEV